MNALSLDSQTLEVYEALQHGAAIIPLAGRSQIEITGADRTTFLHGFCTGDIKKLQPGQGCEAFITNHQGKAVGHVLVFCEEDRLLLDGAPGQAETIIKHLDRFVISERVEFQDRTAEWSDLLLAGPQAEPALSQIPIDSAQMIRLDHRWVSIAVDVLLRRVDWLGTLPAFLLSVANEHLSTLIAELGKESIPIAENDSAWQIARVEAGYPLFGSDITADNLPQEVNRTEQAISFTKGCYLGQETIARLDALGHVNRMLTGLKFPAGANPQPGDVIMLGEKKIAELTSVAYSPKLQAPLALAYVRSLHATPGKRFPYAGGEVEVVKLPLP